MTAAGGGSSPVHLAMVADGLHEVADGDPVHPGKATVLGAVKVIHQESPRLTCACIDVVPPPAGSPREERLIDQLLAEACWRPTAGSTARSPTAAGGAGCAPSSRSGCPGGRRPRRLVAGGAYLVTDGVHGRRRGPRRAAAALAGRAGGAGGAAAVPAAASAGRGGRGCRRCRRGPDVLGAAVKRLSALGAEERERLLLVRAESDKPGAVRAALAQARAAPRPAPGGVPHRRRLHRRADPAQDRRGPARRRRSRGAGRRGAGWRPSRPSRSRRPSCC